MIDMDRRRWLIAQRGVTLDGYEAVISGIREPYATVSTLSGAQYGHQWSWLAVELIVTGSKEFHS